MLRSKNNRILAIHRVGLSTFSETETSSNGKRKARVNFIAKYLVLEKKDLFETKRQPKAPGVHFTPEG